MNVIVVSLDPESTSVICQALQRLHQDYTLLLPEEEPRIVSPSVILSSYQENVEHVMPKWILDNPVRVLGIGRGAELIASTLGGTVVKSETPADPGMIEITELIHHQQVFTQCWMDSSNVITAVPPNFRILGVTANDRICSFTDGNRWLGLQYHPEHPKHGHLGLLRKFLHQI